MFYYWFRQKLSKSTQHILVQNHPLRIPNTYSFWQCKMCNYRDLLVSLFRFPCHKLSWHCHHLRNNYSSHVSLKIRKFHIQAFPVKRRAKPTKSCDPHLGGLELVANPLIVEDNDLKNQKTREKHEAYVHKRDNNLEGHAGTPLPLSTFFNHFSSLTK